MHCMKKAHLSVFLIYVIWLVYSLQQETDSQHAGKLIHNKLQWRSFWAWMRRRTPLSTCFRQLLTRRSTYGVTQAKDKPSQTQTHEHALNLSMAAVVKLDHKVQELSKCKEWRWYKWIRSLSNKHQSMDILRPVEMGKILALTALQPKFNESDIEKCWANSWGATLQLRHQQCAAKLQSFFYWNPWDQKVKC